MRGCVCACVCVCVDRVFVLWAAFLLDNNKWASRSQTMFVWSVHARVSMWVWVWSAHVKVLLELCDMNVCVKRVWVFTADNQSSLPSPLRDGGALNLRWLETRGKLYKLSMPGWLPSLWQNASVLFASQSAITGGQGWCLSFIWSQTQAKPRYSSPAAPATPRNCGRPE